MKLIDFDGMFDEKLAQYMQENKGKYTEKQWEDVIPKLYKKFGDTYVAKVKCTPKEYYAKMTDEQLVETLRSHLQSDVPTPEFLCAEVENRDMVPALCPMLLDKDVQLVTYALNLIGDDERAYDTYFTILEENLADENVQGDLVEVFKFHADKVKERVFANYKKGVAKEYMLEILSRVKERNDEIFNALLSAFESKQNVPMHASYLAAYGDERALPSLLQAIEDESIGFVEFQELKYAIDALGGVYTQVRDFSADKDFLAVEAAFSKNVKLEENGEYRS